ncbi:TetR/AcrR family transcriptional regulator [Alpinimonas psychrophila]
MQEKIANSRETLKAQVWSDIHVAALSLAIEHGLAAATIDRIAEKSGISRRTFFNYFPSKEDAILGIRDPVIAVEALTEFTESAEDNLTRTVFLLWNVFQAARPPSASKMTRREVVEKLPDLLGHFARSGEAVAKLVEPFIRPLFVLPAHSDSSATDGSSEAKMLVSAATAIIISAYLKNPAIAQSDPFASLTAAITSFRKAIS